MFGTQNEPLTGVADVVQTGHRAWSEGRRRRGGALRAHAQMETVSSRQLGDLQTPEVILAHRWPRDFRSEYSSDFEKDDVELQTYAHLSILNIS